MDEKRESGVGVYGNLCVLCLWVRHLYGELKYSDTALRSVEGIGVVLDGGSRKSPRFTVKSKRETKKLTDWLFVSDSVMEIHTFLVTLVKQFDFSLPDNGQEVKTRRVGVITPVVVGEEHKGPQMPLKVTVLGNE